MWKEETLKAYAISWLQDIKDKVVNFVQKMGKEIINHLKKSSFIDEHEGEVTVEGYRVLVEYRREHCHVFQKTT